MPCDCCAMAESLMIQCRTLAADHGVLVGPAVGAGALVEPAVGAGVAWVVAWVVAADPGAKTGVTFIAK